MRTLGLDLSTSAGWALFDGASPESFGRFEKVFVEDFNVNDFPNKSPLYPQNIMDAAKKVAEMVSAKIYQTKPDRIVVENTTKGRNRNTQRCLEWINYAVLAEILSYRIQVSYMDPGEWRKVLELRLTNEDKKNNKEVKAGKKRGKVGKKHLAVREANARWGLALKMKDDDVADALLLTLAFVTNNSSPP